MVQVYKCVRPPLIEGILERSRLLACTAADRFSVVIQSVSPYAVRHMLLFVLGLMNWAITSADRAYGLLQVNGK